jgi:ribonuclease HII
MISWLYHCVISNSTQLFIFVKWKTLFMPTFKKLPNFVPLYYEHDAWAQQKYVIGIDEVGRGCLSGPVVAASVLLKQYAHHELIQDSKLLTPKERSIAYLWLLENANFAVSLVHHRRIDQINIYQATLQAMKKSVMQLLATTAHKPCFILVDAMPLIIDCSEIPIFYFNFAEQLSSSVAAASIIAKVTRDALMCRLDNSIPNYNFSQHKGYGTKGHKQALLEFGPSIIHRKSFLA